VTFVYRLEILRELERHGVQPTSATPPERVHEFVSDLYRYELRRLRDRMRQGQLPKIRYQRTVIELRRRYPILSIRLSEWLEPPVRPE